MSAQRWQAKTIAGPAAQLHERSFPSRSTPELWRLVPARPALVLGSRQEPAVVTAEVRAAGSFEIAPRRSGGGAVLVDPSLTLWVDVFLPRGGPLWSDDLGQTFLEVGARWQDALGGLGCPTEMWSSRPAPETAALGAMACFAGVGWGELTRRGRKVVGLSQRRTRWGARVQCLYDPLGAQRVLVDALDLSLSDRSTLAAIFLPTMSEMPTIDAVWAALVAQLGAVEV